MPVKLQSLQCCLKLGRKAARPATRKIRSACTMFSSASAERAWATPGRTSRSTATTPSLITPGSGAPIMAQAWAGQQYQHQRPRRQRRTMSRSTASLSSIISSFRCCGTAIAAGRTSINPRFPTIRPTRRVTRARRVEWLGFLQSGRQRDRARGLGSWDLQRVPASGRGADAARSKCRERRAFDSTT